jgi:outer membrane protein assembly factor BamD
MLRQTVLMAVLGAVLATVGCSGTAREGSTLSGSGSLEYSVNASTNYEKGLKKLEDEEYLDAAKYFAFVKARFPYSKYAVLADLRLADVAFAAESFVESIDAYRMFIKFHPTHELVTNGYAPFRICEAYLKLLPDDWFLLPPSHEKDQSVSLSAANEILGFLKKFPRSPYTDKAKKMYTKVAHALAAHEWYVAQFYWKRDRPMGTVIRLRALLKQYPEAGYDEEALFLLGRAYVKVGRAADAKRSFQTLIEKYPKHPKVDDAKRELSQIKG